MTDGERRWRIGGGDQPSALPGTRFGARPGSDRPGDLLYAAVAGGITAVQLRSPTADIRARYGAAVALRELLAGTGVAVVVDDRLDIALAAAVDGVHLGSSDLPPDAARRVAGVGFSIGASITGLADLDALAELPDGTVDLLSIGPIFPSTTKPGGSAMDLPGLARPTGIARRVHDERDRPVASVAIGGVDASNAAAVLDTGVDGLAGSAAITRAEDPAAAAATLRAVVDARRA